MLQDDAWDRIAGRVQQDDFYRKDHRLIYQAIETLANTDLLPDAVKSSQWLQALGDL